jgi:hypothetical protein
VIGYSLSKLNGPPSLFSADKVWISSGARGPDQIEASRRFWGVPRFDLLQVHNLLSWEEHLRTLLAMKAAEIEDMVELISNAAKQESVDLFHRFALMRHWHEVDGIPFEAFLSSDGLHMNDWSYNCFAKALADAIADAAAPDRQNGTDAKAVVGETR